MEKIELTYKIRGAIFDTYNALGSGLLEVFMKKLWYIFLRKEACLLKGRSLYLSLLMV